MVTISFFFRTTKFYGRADLGNIRKSDGLIYSYADEPFSIQGDNSKVWHLTFEFTDYYHVDAKACCSFSIIT